MFLFIQEEKSIDELLESALFEPVVQYPNQRGEQVIPLGFEHCYFLEQFFQKMCLSEDPAIYQYCKSLQPQVFLDFDKMKQDLNNLEASRPDASQAHLVLAIEKRLTDAIALLSTKFSDAIAFKLKSSPTWKRGDVDPLPPVLTVGGDPHTIWIKQHSKMGQHT